MLAEAQRASLLQAMGVDVYCLRGGAALAVEHAAGISVEAAMAVCARALGVHLSTMQQNATAIAAVGEPAALLRDGAAKRALWQALKSVARRLRAMTE